MISPAPTGVCPHRDLHPGRGLHHRLAELRTQAPVTRVELHGRVPVWLVTRATDVERALTDDVRLSSDARWLNTTPSQGDTGRSSVKVSLMGLDGAKHSRLRRILARPFGPRPIEALRPRVQALTDEIVDHLALRLKQRASVDLVRDLALPLPRHVICDLLGIPTADRDHVHQHARHLLDPRIGPVDRERVRQQLRDRISPHLAASTLVSTFMHDSALTREEVIDAGVLLFLAGYETTAALISSILLRLLDDRAPHYQALTEDPSLIPAVVDEVARLEGPVGIGVTRYSTTASTIAGICIPAGQRVLLSLGAADHDPDRWPHPDQFDLARPGGRTLAFGHGPHYCLGERLARMEVHIALAALARRLPQLVLAEPADSIARRSGIFHGPARLPVLATHTEGLQPSR